MSNVPYGRAGALALVLILSACKDGGKDPLAPRALRDEAAAAPELAVAAAPVSTLLGRATFSDPHDENLDIKRITGDWHVQIKAKPAMDIAVQSIAFPAGSQSTWHSHPGPVFIQVVKGTMTFYESDDPTCTPEVYTAGQGYLDLGDHAHIARNETSAPAQNIVTYFAPPGTALRTDVPKPGNCPF
jgi:hypothetical protein